MNIYPWKEDTKEALPHIKKDDRHPNPIGRCETDVPTPTDISAGYVVRALLTVEGWFKAWELVVDNRGKEYWTQDGVKHSISDLGVEVPAGCLMVPPPSSLYLIHDGSSWFVDLPLLIKARRQERDGKLLASYSPAIEQLTRWIDIAEGDPAALGHYKTQRSAWHAWADALCDLPDHPDWPWPEDEIPWPEQPPKPTRYAAP
ncbi:hypothetical protein [Desulfoluna spongiiphila]|uniref:hypothetical protein n=1 Tax=Desulfoluna spongiiphila TaxID=419481 RepID=UPI0012590FB5|nr:hypothetical protein [Desulfoluna spongiiphila]VVS91076.1 consensus disorder prediction [Desulfoluna spongiiphila]